MAVASRIRPERVVATLGVICFLMMFLPWFDDGGVVKIILYNAKDGSPELSLTGWEAFSGKDLVLAAVAVGLAITATLRPSRGKVALRVLLAGAGAALAVVMIASPPPTPRDFEFHYLPTPESYSSTGVGWIAGAAFAAAAVFSGLSRSSSSNTDEAG